MSDTPQIYSCGRSLKAMVLFSAKLERKLNAATSEIERLTQKVSKLYEGAEEQKQRIKQLETENDAMRADLLLWSEQEVKP